ncbi:DNA-3-methyladenine glycosylase I [Apibacter sp. B3889]|uniref:DNA-3-methyladenine glycosylase I n=1 Tax=unclassified Apibacter TaxID=2630820 RepID=UPI00132538FF|nr:MULTISPECIES: DNA-3-methyladenine glycosylase I [unclassified Apibacter]MXO33412.1 DNA-3-methyladenine glycosylase I [Apibacter sp. B3883]MXO40769.1 DNA-3-methyladenine glycosylase I [Apibacter sp. B3889]MXP03938.1 DNA-3-methyladenine glycosylase I [Apibacter sp. B3887]MXP07251.1 DNA-3-methyladenine glycosylase I [Apibacter sp. B3935]
MEREIIRCEWVGSDDIYKKYHDEEWGKPVYDDRLLFEFLLLEGFQAGLSWITVLKKRESIREAFDNFDYKKISQYTQEKMDRLLLNEGVIRNKLKIKAATINAQKYMDVQNEFGSFSNYLWNFVNHTPICNHWETIKQVPASTQLSDSISKDLKKRGFKFVGTTIIYAFLQAVGVVNDHILTCSFHPVNH